MRIIFFDFFDACSGMCLTGRDLLRLCVGKTVVCSTEREELEGV